MSTLKKLKQKLSRGSILVFTLLVMFILLISALGIASVTVIERKTSGTTGKSTQSFQVADSGAEIVLQKIYKDDLRTVDDLVVTGGLNCVGNGVIIGSIATGKDFEITFEDDSGSDITSCTDNTTEISRIKSVGSYAQTSRAIEVAVAAAVCPPIVSSSGDSPQTVDCESGCEIVRCSYGHANILSSAELEAISAFMGYIPSGYVCPFNEFGTQDFTTPFTIDTYAAVIVECRESD